MLSHSATIRPSFSGTFRPVERHFYRPDSPQVPTIREPLGCGIGRTRLNNRVNLFLEKQIYTIPEVSLNHIEIFRSEKSDKVYAVFQI